MRRDNAETVFKQWRLERALKTNEQKEQKNKTRESEELKRKSEEEQKEMRKAESEKVLWLSCKQATNDYYRSTKCGYNTETKSCARNELDAKGKRHVKLNRSKPNLKRSVQLQPNASSNGNCKPKSIISKQHPNAGSKRRLKS